MTTTHCRDRLDEMVDKWLLLQGVNHSVPPLGFRPTQDLGGEREAESLGDTLPQGTDAPIPVSSLVSSHVRAMQEWIWFSVSIEWRSNPARLIASIIACRREPA